MNDDFGWDKAITVEGTIETEADPATYARMLEWACAPIIANVFGGPLDGLEVKYDPDEARR